MKHLSKFQWLVVAGLFLASLNASSVRAFSLIGPFEPWMTVTNGFTPAIDIGGPMLIGLGYRWNVPVLTYGFDPSFLDYFGSNGVAAVTSAINLLNSLPPASQIVPGNFPDNTTFYNYEAETLGLADLKSTTLFLLLEHLGLASPDRSAFNLRSFTIANGTVEAVVEPRNYDPVTDLPSASVNGNLLAYDASYFVSSGVTNAALYIYPTDPYGPFDSAVADGLQSVGVGAYYNGLTADDVGGLRYLYSTNSVHYEFLLPGVQLVGTGSLVNGALRPGVDKITFAPQPVDPVSGAFLSATNQFMDTYFTNGAALRQLVARVTTQPDFLFSATDLVATTAWFDRTGITHWMNNAAFNGHPDAAGPGVIQAPVNIRFNQFGPVWESGNSISEDTPMQANPLSWGTFDGSTNGPVTFPSTSHQTNATPVRLTLMVNHQTVNYRWVINNPTNHNYWLLTSTNLNGSGLAGWRTLFVIPVNGKVSSYLNITPTSARRFYQLVPVPF